MRRLASLIAVSTLVLVAGPARADRLVAKGTTLSGSVKAVTSAGIEFQPDFAKDAMLVPWDNVEDVSTESPYQVLYGNEEEADAPIRGYHDGKLAVGDASVDPATIVSAAAEESATPGLRERMRAAMRYWHGGVDFGLNVQQATTDNFGTLVAFHTIRSKDPTRLILGADYRYANEDDKVSPKKATKDSASALVRGEYDLTKHLYAFASTDVLYDSIQNLSLRAVPKLGAGVVLWEREPSESVRDFLSVEAGGGWVYEKYIDNGLPPDVLEDDDYFTIAFGAAAAVLLPRGISFDWRFDYLPNVTDWGDYVIRTGAGVSMLVFAPISLRLGIVDVYDSTPSQDADENSLNLDTALTLGW